MRTEARDQAAGGAPGGVSLDDAPGE